MGRPDSEAVAAVDCGIVPAHSALEHALESLVVFALLLAIAFAAGCAHSRVSMSEYDGTKITMSEWVLFGKRDASSLSGRYEWRTDSSGEWVVGANAAGTDSTDAIAAIIAGLEVWGKIGIGLPVETPKPSAPERLGLRLLERSMTKETRR